MRFCRNLIVSIIECCFCYLINICHCCDCTTIIQINPLIIIPKPFHTFVCFSASALCVLPVLVYRACKGQRQDFVNSVTFSICNFLKIIAFCFFSFHDKSNENINCAIYVLTASIYIPGVIVG